MENIIVDKKSLLDILKKNREDHRGIFEEALKGFHISAEKELADWIERIKIGRRASISIQLEAPKDHTRDYDRVISMIEMDLSSKIELRETDFKRYVMDDWEWQRDFLNDASLHSSNASIKGRLLGYD